MSALRNGLLFLGLLMVANAVGALAIVFATKVILALPWARESTLAWCIAGAIGVVVTLLFLNATIKVVGKAAELEGK